MWRKIALGAAVLCALALCVGLVVQEPSTWVAVSDAEAAALLGGDCDEFDTGTCSGSHAQCFFTTGYDDVVGGSITDKQSFAEQACGTFDIETENYCGWVADIEDCEVH